MTTRPQIQTITSIVLLAAMIAGGWFEHYAKGPNAAYALDWFAVWIATPFVLMLVAVALAHSVRAQVVVLFVSGILTAAGIFFYRDAMFVHVDAQGALVFLFIPLYQLVIVVITLAGVGFARVRARRAADRPT